MVEMLVDAECPMAKLQLRDRTQAAIFAHETGLVRPNT
jgi:hypothetical protein